MIKLKGVFEKGFCFFFQAEDGIRDTSVTGVQTCALPICFRQVVAGAGRDLLEDQLLGAATAEQHAERSEERRVGKELRSLVEQHNTKIKNKDQLKGYKNNRKIYSSKSFMTSTA